MRFLRTAVLAVIGLLALSWVAIAVSNKARLLVAKNYFKHERQDWTPTLAKWGIVRPVRMQLEPGVSLNLDPQDLVSVSILRSHEWQAGVWTALNSRLMPGAVLLDVGAHIGYFSMKGAAKVGPKGRVVSFEPNPETLVQLRSNVDASHVESIVTVEPIAATDHDQQLTLYAARGINTGASSLSKDNAGVFDEHPQGYPVRGRPIDDVVSELGLTRVDAIKIDVEGAEVSVLRGALKTLTKYHPKVVIEVDERQLAGFGTKPADVEALLKQAGYNQSRQVDDNDWEWYCLCPDNTMPDVRTANLAAVDQLVKGFYGVEQNAWRWAGREFVIALNVPQTVKPVLTLDIAVPQTLLEQIGGSTTLHARIGATELAPQTYTTNGNFAYQRELPAGTQRGVVEIVFKTDKAIGPRDGDPRELGLVVIGAAIR